MRKLLLLAAVAAPFAIAVAAFLYANQSTPPLEPQAVPLAQFEADPDSFGSQILTLQGFLVMGDGSARLYASELEAKHGLDANTVRLAASGPEAAALDHHYVMATGRADSEVAGQGKGIMPGHGRVPWLRDLRSLTALPQPAG